MASDRSKIALIVLVVVVVAGIVAYVAYSYANAATEGGTYKNGVRITYSSISCIQIQNTITIGASFRVTNFASQTESVQVQLVVGNGVLTQNSYTLGPSGSSTDSYDGHIEWSVSSCPSGIHLQLA